MDIQFASGVSLFFYDIISVQITGGREIPIWGKNISYRLDGVDSELVKLVFTSKRPVSINQARELQAVIRKLNEKGWYYEIV